MMEEIKHLDQSHIKLIKGQKDSYGWEISVYGDDLAAVLDKIRLVDVELRVMFPANEIKA